MRANKGQSPDEIRERYLGEIAPLLAAARNVESLSLAQKKQVRKRVMRTVFGSRAQRLRLRLTPVMAGVGLLVAGGVAFATAERLGFIHRADQGPSNARGTDADAHKRGGSHARPGLAQDALPVRGALPDVGERLVLPQIPDPLLTEPAQVGAPPSLIRMPLVPTGKPEDAIELRGGRSRAATGRARHGLDVAGPARAAFVRPQPARQLALATPYLADPGEGSAAFPPGAEGRSVPAPALPNASSAPADGVPPSPVPQAVAPQPARQQPTPAPVSAASSAAPPMPKVSVSDPVLFGQALRKLRNEHNPTGALVALQQHAQAYPRSAFSGERNALEVEALLALHRDREALQKLDGTRLDGLPRSGERFVVRGELRAAARRWLDAKEDFDEALSRVSGSPAWHERALWGRGVARLRCGERQAGMADIERYHDLYPQGRFAAEARRFFPSQ